MRLAGSNAALVVVVCFLLFAFTDSTVWEYCSASGFQASLVLRRVSGSHQSPLSPCDSRCSIHDSTTTTRFSSRTDDRKRAIASRLAIGTPIVCRPIFSAVLYRTKDVLCFCFLSFVTGIRDPKIACARDFMARAAQNKRDRENKDTAIVAKPMLIAGALRHWNSCFVKTPFLIE